MMQAARQRADVNEQLAQDNGRGDGIWEGGRARSEEGRAEQADACIGTHTGSCEATRYLERKGTRRPEQPHRK